MTATELATQTPTQLIESNSDHFIKALPSVVDATRFLDISLSLIRTTPGIRKCKPESIPMAIYGCAKLGLVPDPALGHVYVVPVKGVATVWLGYRGYIELGRRSGKIQSVHAGIVYTDEANAEKFDWWIDEDGAHLRHHPMFGGPDDRERFAAYCVATMNNGSPSQIAVMSAAEVIKIKKASAGYKHDPKGSPWATNEDEMWKKTAVRRGSKMWPLSPELAYAVQLDEEAERGVRQSISPQLDDETHPPVADAGADELLQDVIGSAGTKIEDADSPDERFPNLIDYVAVKMGATMDVAEDAVEKWMGSQKLSQDALGNDQQWQAIKAAAEARDWT